MKLHNILSIIFWTIVMSTTANGQFSSFNSVILINGDPYFAQVSSDGDLIQTFEKIPEYFRTKESHEHIVNRMRSEFSTEIVEINNAEYIEYDQGKALLTSHAINHIRELAVKLKNNKIEKIGLVGVQSDDESSQILAKNRIQGVVDLLIAFGVDPGLINTKLNYDKNASAQKALIRVNY